MALQSAAVAKTKNRKTDVYMTEYFKSANTATRTEVEDVFRKAARECSTKGTDGTINCEIGRRHCKGNVFAYTVPEHGWIAYCPEYFQELKRQTSICGEDDQAITTLHEVTHLTQIKGTKDHAYNVRGVKQLSRENALDNADTYALFANGE